MSGEPAGYAARALRVERSLKRALSALSLASEAATTDGRRHMLRQSLFDASRAAELLNRMSS